MRNKIKLNLGCGRTTKEGYVNVDMRKAEGVNVVHDLNVYPYPFEDSSVDEIFAQDVIEHLDRPQLFIEELWRICKNGAKIHIRTGHFTSATIYGCLTHVRGFSIGSMNYFLPSLDKTKTIYLDYDKGGNDVIIDFKGKLLFNRYYRWIGLEWFFNRYSKLYENVLCFIFPCGLLKWDGIVIKGGKNGRNIKRIGKDC